MIDTIDGYLDRLFDLLAGSGPLGRRLYSEAEVHLEEAAALGVAAGRSRAEAERAAIARFGAPEDIAHASIKLGALSPQAALTRIFAAAWLMGATACLVICTMGLLKAPLEQFAGLADESAAAREIETLASAPLAVGLFGLLLLAAFWLAQRSRTFRPFAQLPNAAMVSAAGAVGFGGIGLVLFAYGLYGLAAGQHDEVVDHLAEGLAGISAGLMFLPQAWRHLTLARD